MSVDKLLPSYERELTLLRQYLNEFAERYPRVATNLSISGGVSEDPQVERLLQSFALLGARANKKLDDDTPEFTHALLNVTYPHFLRPIPSYSIAQFSLGSEVKDMGITTIPRGTPVKAPAVDLIEYRFRTAYDVTLAPVTISNATYTPTVHAPASVRLPPDATGCISITFSSIDPQQLFTRPNLKNLRTYINGEPAFVAALRDGLFLHRIMTFIEKDSNGVWLPIHDPEVLTEVGYQEDEGLIPTESKGYSVHRLLSEYVTFPEKFNFFDVNFSSNGLNPANTHHFTLHLVLNSVRADSKTARVLEGLSATNLRLACTPIINLFDSESKPVTINDPTTATTACPIALHARDASSYEVYSIDKVTLTSKVGSGSDTTECQPLYSLHHGTSLSNKNVYWTTQRNDSVMTKILGYEDAISIVDSNLKPIQPQDQILNMQLTCTNRNLSTQLQIGSPGGDLMLDDTALACQIGLLKPFSQSIPVDYQRGTEWRLISHLRPNYLSLSQQGLPALKEMLLLYNVTNSDRFDKQIQSLKAIDHKVADLWVKGKPHAQFQRGIEIHVTIDENNFVGSSVRGFIRLLEHFFSLYINVNSFTHLIVYSDSGTTICKCEPRSGVIDLI